MNCNQCGDSRVTSALCSDCQEQVYAYVDGLNDRIAELEDVLDQLNLHLDFGGEPVQSGEWDGINFVDAGPVNAVFKRAHDMIMQSGERHNGTQARRTVGHVQLGHVGNRRRHPHSSAGATMRMTSTVWMWRGARSRVTYKSSDGWR